MKRPTWMARASAEFALIVVGVLAALALEGWWSDLRDRRAESQYLADLHDEAARNLEQLDLSSGVFLDAQADLKLAARLIEVGQHLDSAGVFVVRLVRGGSMLRAPFLTDAVFRDLQSSGRLQLIRDNDLRRQIIIHNSRAAASLTRLSAWEQDIAGRLAGLVTRHLPMDLVNRGVGQREVGISPDADARALATVARALAQDPQLIAEIRAEFYALEQYRSGADRLRLDLEEYVALLSQAHANQ